MMTLGSLFSGIGGFELGGLLAGISPQWLSEIEPFTMLVTHKYLPGVKQYGDVRKLNGAELEPVYVVTAGFPCQSVSISGRREGADIDGANGNEWRKHTSTNTYYADTTDGTATQEEFCQKKRHM